MADTISTKQAAQRLHTSPPTVRAMIETGELKGFKEARGAASRWRVDAESVEAYLSANGPLRGVRRASKSRMAQLEKEVAALRSLVEAGLPAGVGLERLEEDRDDLRARVVTLSETVARARTVTELQARAEDERASVNEHLLAALAASERADDLRRQAIGQLDEALAAHSRAGHAGSLRRT